jgi:uncharacterized protein
LINPRDKTGTLHKQLTDVGEPIDAVNLIINSRDGLTQVGQMAQCGIKQLWIQPGAGSDEITTLAAANGIEVSSL